MRRAETFAVLVAGAAVLCSPALASPPTPVSPAGLVEQGCPTFSWSGVTGAPGYELAVHRISEGQVEQTPSLSVRLPTGVTVWTPPATRCLSSGERYVWTLRVLGQELPDEWSEPALFRVAAAPSPDEIEAAIATLERELAAPRGPQAESPAPPTGTTPEPVEGESPPRTPRHGPAVFEEERAFVPVTGASVPSLGTPSLSVDANIAMGGASNVFKDGSVFLWNDTDGNTALGRHALASATGAYALRGTAVGFRALTGNTHYDNTAIGYRSLYTNADGSGNTVLGVRALFSNTSGVANTVAGGGSLSSNTIGAHNTVSGDLALYHDTEGSHNTASGPLAMHYATGSTNTALGTKAFPLLTTGDGGVAVGYIAARNLTDGSDSIYILNDGPGTPTEPTGESNKIRIGTQGIQNATFIAGISGVTTGAGAVTVVIDSAGQLGTTSSSRAVKQDIRGVEELSRRLLDLRPVVFRYRDHVARDPDALPQFGLIAEEVAETFPELVVRDSEGRPQTVKYHLLPPLLLNELQRLDRTLDERGEEIDTLQYRVTAIEKAPSSEPQKRTTPWWRRLFGARNGPG